jgi:bis(5'-nucleosidyl)-tetraphosphatase
MKLRDENFLKEYIRSVIAERDYHSISCGIVVVKKFGNKWRPLSLIVGSKLDIPKGKIEEGENTLEAAIRETFEESGIYDLNFLWGKESFRVKNMVVYLASTTQEAKILPNPVTGRMEHDSWKWMDWDDMISRSSPKIAHSLAWAKRKIQQNDLLTSIF